MGCTRWRPTAIRWITFSPIYFGRYSFRENDPVSGYLDEVYRRVKGLKQWYCGHMHADIAKEGYRLTVLYEDCAEIP